MRYTSSGAFRQALEDRLRTERLDTGTPLVRLRKMVPFERALKEALRTAGPPRLATPVRAAIITALRERDSEAEIRGLGREVADLLREVMA